MSKKHQPPRSWKKKMKERKRTEERIAETQEDFKNRHIQRLKEAGRKAKVVPSGKIKMSEVILNLIEPFLIHAESMEDQKILVQLAIQGWNIALLPEKEQKKFIEENFREFKKKNRDVHIVEMAYIEEYYKIIRQRKKELYPDLDYPVTDYEMLETPKGLHLNVAYNRPDKDVDSS